MSRTETRIAVVGLTVSGNKGAESMLLAIMHEMEQRVGACRFDLLTVYPGQDRRQPLPPNLHLVAAKPITMLLLVLPLSVLLAPLLRFGLVRRLLRANGVFRALIDSELVIDASGVAFVDGRGLPLLAYNLSLCLPPALLGRPIIKVAQALGPLRGRLNRWLGGWALRRVNRVAARGAVTAEHLAQLGLTNYELCADTAFLMPVDDAARRTAEECLPLAASGRRRVGISPSVVVDDYCREHGIDYAGVLAQFVRDLRAKSLDVVLIPHSLRPESRKRMNNDLIVCQDVLARLGGDAAGVTLIERELSAPALRALIGRMDFYLASRFHSMVSALASQVPTLLVGWSHKYREVMRMFDLEDWAMGYERLTPQTLRERFDSLLANEPAIRAKLAEHLPEVQRLAARNFDLAAELLPGCAAGAARPQSLLPVLQSHMCIACGACVAADPSLSLVFDEETQMHQPSGPGSSAAAAVCPAIRVDFADLQSRLFPGQPVTEHGVVERVFLAQSTDRDRNLRASSGGLIKELLRHYLAQPGVDGAIALGHVRGLKFEPRLIRSANEVDALPGSIYHNLPLDGALRLLRENAGRFVLVAIPCQLEGIYNYVHRCEPELRSRIHTTIGLICGWNYSHHALRAICRFKGLDFDAIEQISYRGGGPVGKLRIVTPRGEAAIHRRVDFAYQVAFDRSFNLPRCHLCINHTNFLADVVVGDAWLPSTVGTKTGISIVVCRRPDTVQVMKALADGGQIRSTPVGVEEIAESQSRRIAMGDFSYAYADYLRSTGRHAPDMTGPNRAAAKLVSRRQVRRFDRALRVKLRLQRERRYRRLLLRKATLEIGPFLGRYFRWFAVRVLKVKSLLGRRKEVAREQLAGFE
ncbi:MAG: polysaccharide pyruvyl transferase family protein [Phycisphaerae bacterium]|jgi:coenzyme F420-reducing hydrogenase beta subunit/polysaccharide pyruvyl transferase WcaK-like protein